jgi:dTDP-4-dehydrorhamnose reductase
MRHDLTSLSDPQNRERPKEERPGTDPTGTPTTAGAEGLETQEKGVAVATAPKPKRVFVTGGHGMLGSDLVVELQGRGWTVTAPNIKEFDLRRKDHLESLRVRDFGNLDWVLNCAAYTDVDEAESDFFAAHQVNGVAPGALAFICEKNDWRFLQVSTDFVFDGLSREPYTERHVAAPQGKYGMSKLMGERNAIENHARTVVARTAWLYGPNGRSFPRTMIKAWLEGKPLRVVSDQTGSPTYTADLARVLADLVACDAPPGIYHTAGPDAMTWHDLALIALETYRDAVLGQKREVSIEPIPTSAWPTPAKRPAYSVLSFEKTASLGIQPMRSTPAAMLDFCLRLPKTL